MSQSAATEIENPIGRRLTTTFHPRRARSKTKMGNKNKTNSVGTTKKPTSTNRTKRMARKTEMASTSKRKEIAARETATEMPEEALAKTRRPDLERSTSRQTQSRTTRIDTREETLKEVRELTTRSGSELKGTTTTPILTRGMSSEDHQEAWHQWIEATSMAIQENICLRTHSGATMISMLDRARRESEASRTRHTTMTEIATGITFS